MTLGEMVTQVRVDIGDSNSTTWTTDVPIRKAINLAAQHIAKQIEKHGHVLYSRGSISFTTSSNTTAYALTSATDFQSVWRMFRTDEEEDTIEISEPEKYLGPSIDDQGRWVYYLTRNASTGVFSVNFPFAPPAGMSFTVIYKARTPALATDGTADSSSYTTIDADFHELVCARAAMRLLQPDGSNLQAATLNYTELMQDMISTLGRRSAPAHVIDETGW